MTALAEPYEMAPPSFLQHMRALESAGLVRSEKRGRERIYELEGERLLTAENWLDRSRRAWEARLDQLEAAALSLKENVNPK
jgi:DNA-binding transcriptional ArsR family regulator